ncbi:hypothetical protein BJ508DRAFT_314293 [Ascobolus immersus RN42]|uniref:Uncharacterized protein n=1 Tax=Ascobolus immersus RN42 TaxID=1160509 RepID=A0A3N4HFK6_ASCIM|nr:hypothetical protein BJ508DRAFT_314293 [Ascobolus immersus RN42]
MSPRLKKIAHRAQKLVKTADPVTRHVDNSRPRFSLLLHPYAPTLLFYEIGLTHFVRNQTTEVTREISKLVFKEDIICVHYLVNNSTSTTISRLSAEVANASSAHKYKYGHRRVVKVFECTMAKAQPKRNHEAGVRMTSLSKISRKVKQHLKKWDTAVQESRENLRYGTKFWRDFWTLSLFRHVQRSRVVTSRRRYPKFTHVLAKRILMESFNYASTSHPAMEDRRLLFPPGSTSNTFRFYEYTYFNTSRFVQGDDLYQLTRRTEYEFKREDVVK